MKRPTKAELYEMLHAQELENIKLCKKLEDERIREWEKKIPEAFEKLKNDLREHFGSLATMIKYEHVDESGYWFTFELVNDNRRQTLRINHNEI